MCLTVGEGPVRGIWQYDLNDGTDNRAGRGRIVGKTSHLDVLRYAAARSQPDPKRVRSSRLRILPLALWMEHQSRNVDIPELIEFPACRVPGLRYGR
jgi:hypothetical protein